MRLHVEVTQDDIDKGCKTDAIGANGGCMVWLAFQRATEGAFDQVTVNYEAITVRSGAHRHGLPTGGGVWSKIWHFDQGHKVKPFAFDVEIPVGVGG